MAHIQKRKTHSVVIFATGLSVALLSSLVSANDSAVSTEQDDSAAIQHVGYQGFKDPTYGIELGLEQQSEYVEDRKVVQRTYGRAQGTVDWEVYKDVRGSTVDAGIKAGLIGGKYKGSNSLENEFGSIKESSFGGTGEASVVYTHNNRTIDPFIGLKAEFEHIKSPRIEYQADALAGVRFNVSDDKDLSIRYGHTLIHGMNYYRRESVRYRQDDGYAVALIGTKRMPNKTSHTLKLEYEHFDKSPLLARGEGLFSYEPDTDNWLLSYKKTF